MAKAKKKEKLERKGPHKAAGPAVTFELPKLRVAPREDFTYTSPSAIPARSAKARREHGCEEQTVETGKQKGKRKFTGRLKDGRPSSFCKSTSKPCGERASCPVQLVWLDGKPNLRFCISPGAPGHIVEVASASQAQALAQDACKGWPNPKKKVRWPQKYFEKQAPGVVAAARRNRPSSPWGKPGLGAAQAFDPYEDERPAESYQAPLTPQEFFTSILPFVAIGFAATWLLKPPSPQLPASTVQGIAALPPSLVP